MRRHLHTIAAAGFLGTVTLGLVPLACGSGLGKVTVRQNGPDKDAAVPAITVRRLQECFTVYGEQLEPKEHRFNPTVQVDQEGVTWGVTTDDMPKSADDFAACTRMALTDMAIPEGILKSGGTTATNEATEAQRSYMGSPALVVVVVVGLSEIVLEAGAYTILFAVTVKVLDKAKDDVLDAAKRWRPRPNKNRCLDAAAGGEYMWEEFCRSMKVPGNCWSKTLESEQSKRGWCNEKFGS